MERSIYEHIRILRISENYTQDYMAKCLGIRQPAYSNIEKGKTKMKMEYLKVFAEIFITDFHELVEIWLKTEQ